MRCICIAVTFVKRNIDAVSLNFPLSSVFISSCAWKKTFWIKSVHTEKKNIWILVKNIICAIAMVHIPINDHYALAFMSLPQVLSSNSYIVEKTKPRNFLLGSMMPWWSNDCHTAMKLGVLLHTSIYQIQQRSRRHHSAVRTSITHVRIWAKGKTKLF